MARTAALPRVEGLAPSVATRGATAEARCISAVPSSTRGRVTATAGPRSPRRGPPDAPTVRLPVVRDAGASRSRVRGIDAARGLALLGMIAVHTLPMSENGELTTVGLLAGGTSAALFGLLVGVSVALLTGRRRVAVGAGSFGTHALRLAVRGLAVGVLGLALGEAALGDVDIILTYYGVLFLLAIPLILLPTRALFALGAVLAVVAPITSHLVRAGMPPAELIDPSFTALVTDPAGLLTTLFLTGAYPIWPWLTYLCVGMAVGRCSLATTRTAAVLAACGVALVAAAAAVSHLALVTAGGLGRILADPGLPAEELQAALTEGPNGVTPATTWWWLAVDTAHSSTPLDLARTVGTSLAVLGAMLLARPGPRPGRLVLVGPDRRRGAVPAGGGRLDDADLLHPPRRRRRDSPREADRALGALPRPGHVRPGRRPALAALRRARSPRGRGQHAHRRRRPLAGLEPVGRSTRADPPVAGGPRRRARARGHRRRRLRGRRGPDGRDVLVVGHERAGRRCGRPTARGPTSPGTPPRPTSRSPPTRRTRPPRRTRGRPGPRTRTTEPHPSDALTSAPRPVSGRPGAQPHGVR